MKLAVALVSALVLVAPATQAANVDPVFRAFKAGVPGCAVGVAARGEAPSLRAYGAADLEHGVANTPETVFEAGSVSKQFTAAAILSLVAEGKLALGDDIRKYLPEMPDYGAPITIQHLLNHTSGLRDWGEVAGIAGWPRTSRTYSNAEALQITARQKALNYPVGTAYSYTNTGYNLAAVIVQRVSGQSLADYTRARFFQPLGMSHTTWRDDFRHVVPNRAIAYDPVGSGWTEDMPFENAYGNGGLLTTVGDLLIWNAALSAGKLDPFVTQKLQEPSALADGRPITYARGLFVQTYNGRREISHSGATAGYRAWLARYPDEGLSVAILCNAGQANPTALGRRVVDFYLAPPPMAPAAAGPTVLPPEELAYAGRYVDERLGMSVRIVADGGALMVQGGNPFRAVGPGRYRAGETELVFGPESLERRTPDGEAASFRKVEPWTPTQAETASIPGRYVSDEAAAQFMVSISANVLRITPSDRPSAPVLALPLYRDAFGAGGQLIRLSRDTAGKVTALHITSGRVYDLVLKRAP